MGLSLSSLRNSSDFLALLSSDNEDLSQFYSKQKAMGLELAFASLSPFEQKSILQKLGGRKNFRRLIDLDRSQDNAKRRQLAQELAVSLGFPFHEEHSLRFSDQVKASLKSFCEDLFDPWMILGFTLGSYAFQRTRLGALKTLAKSPDTFFSRGFMARTLSWGLGTGAEIATFSGVGLSAQVYAGQKLTWQDARNQIASSTLTLLPLKLGFVGGGTLQKTLAKRNLFLNPHLMTHATAVGALYFGHEAQAHYALAPHRPWQENLYHSVLAQTHMTLSGHIAHRMMGKNYADHLKSLQAQTRYFEKVVDNPYVKAWTKPVLSQSFVMASLASGEPGKNFSEPLLMLAEDPQGSGKTKSDTLWSSFDRRYARLIQGKNDWDRLALGLGKKVFEETAKSSGMEKDALEILERVGRLEMEKLLKAFNYTREPFKVMRFLSLALRGRIPETLDIVLGHLAQDKAENREVIEARLIALGEDILIPPTHFSGLSIEASQGDRKTRLSYERIPIESAEQYLEGDLLLLWQNQKRELESKSVLDENQVLFLVARDERGEIQAFNVSELVVAGDRITLKDGMNIHPHPKDGMLPFGHMAHGFTLAKLQFLKENGFWYESGALLHHVFHDFLAVFRKDLVSRSRFADDMSIARDEAEEFLGNGFLKPQVLSKSLPLRKISAEERARVESLRKADFVPLEFDLPGLVGPQTIKVERVTVAEAERLLEDRLFEDFEDQTYSPRYRNPDLSRAALVLLAKDPEGKILGYSLNWIGSHQGLPYIRSDRDFRADAGQTPQVKSLGIAFTLAKAHFALKARAAYDGEQRLLTYFEPGYLMGLRRRLDSPVYSGALFGEATAIRAAESEALLSQSSEFQLREVKSDLDLDVLYQELETYRKSSSEYSLARIVGFKAGIRILKSLREQGKVWDKFQWVYDHVKEDLELRALLVLSLKRVHHSMLDRFLDLLIEKGRQRNQKSFVEILEAVGHSGLSASKLLEERGLDASKERPIRTASRYVDITDDELYHWQGILTGRHLIKEEDYAEPQGVQIQTKAPYLGPATAHDRVSGDAYNYYRTSYQEQLGLVPLLFRCEIDAIRLAQRLIDLSLPDAQILEIRSSKPALWHYQSTWSLHGQGVRYDGIHYAVISDGRVYDLQSTLEPGLPLEDYLEGSFPKQVTRPSILNVLEFRTKIRFMDRRYRVFQGNNYKLFPELRDP